MLVVSIVFWLGFGSGLRVREADQKKCHRPDQGTSGGTLHESIYSPPKNLSTEKTSDLPKSSTWNSSDQEARRIFKAICLWEHRGVIRPDDVSCAGAVGPAQITQIFLNDINSYLNTSYTLTDCKDYEIAYRITVGYWKKYNLTTDEERARCHLAGPRAMTRQKTWQQTSEYWEGVKKYLQNKKISRDKL